MKKLMFTWLLSMIFLSAVTAQRGVERSGYEGDYFNLEGAIDLFKNSHTIRDFERRLNREDAWVNNLDLNYDGEIDYIRVEHIREGKFHAIILQAVIDRYDVQDVAVIEIEKTGRRRAMLQIVGDEDLYGEEVIVEPYGGGDGYSNGRGGPNADYEFRRGYVNVFYWNPVQHIFGRNYHRYVSPWRYSYYPSYYRPWRQCGWNIFRPRIVIFHHHYHVVHIHRVHRVHNFYRPHRHYSHHVNHRSNEVRVKHGRPAVHRTASNNHKVRKNITERKGKIKNGRTNATAQKHTPRDRNRTSTRSTRTPNKVDKGRTNSTTRTNTSRDRTRTSTKPSRSSQGSDKGRVNSTRETRKNNGGKVRQGSTTKPQRSSSKAKKSRSSSSPSRSSSTRSSKPRSNSKSSAKSSRSSSPNRSSSTRSSKPRSSSKSSSRSSRSSSSSKKSSRSKSSSKGSSRKGRG